MKTKGTRWFSEGDTLRIKPENTYYEVEYRKGADHSFTLYPRAQVNPNMGLMVSPDIKRNLSADLYTHISSIPDPEAGPEWEDTVVLKTPMKPTILY